MHDEDISRGSPRDFQSPTEREDAIWQQAILGVLLEHYPAQLTREELSREMLGERPDQGDRDRCQRAIEDLIRAGLLQSCEQLILPTRAARHYHALEG